MRNINKLALGVALALASGSTFADTFESVTSEAVSVEGASAGALSANIGGDSIVVDPSKALSVDNRLYITLPTGMTFADSTYTLEQSAAGAGTGDLSEFILVTGSPAGKSELEFKAASAIVPTEDFILSGSSVAGQAVSFNLPAQAAGAGLSIGARAEDTFGVFSTYTSVELFEYTNQFSATVDTIADTVIDVNEGRILFTDGGSVDTVVIDLSEAVITNELDLNDSDKVDIVLSGDMSGLASLTLDTPGDDDVAGVVDLAAGTATFSASASDAFAGTGSNTITITGDSATPLVTRTFTVQVDADFDAETDKNLVAAGTAAGEFTINGLQAKVSHLSLNVGGFLSFLKVVNEGTTDAEVTADISYTTGGVSDSVSNVSLGTAMAGGVFTVSEASILSALGNPTGVVDVHMTVTVAGPVNSTHLVAEKKASDGRTTVPVYYDTNSTRSWMQ